VRIVLLLSILLSAELHAAQTVPAVYRDEYLSIHAGVAEIGSRPIHVGDQITFLMQLEFNGEQLRVEALDSDFFRRAFEDQRSIRLYAPPLVTQKDGDDHQIVIHASWPFQILDCPDDLAHCNGDRNHALPVISISYQIIDDAGQVVNDKLVRFRPKPGSIAVASALAHPDGAVGEFADHFPGGAHPGILAVGSRQGAAMIAMVAGILLLVVVFNKEQPGQQEVRAQLPANRWQHVLSELQQRDMHDDEWADLLRRCASWYCLDELGRNPHTQLETDFDRFFADVLSRAEIDAAHRDEYLGTFKRLAGEDS